MVFKKIIIMKIILIFLSAVLLNVSAQAQKIKDYPQWIVNAQPTTPSVTLYAKEAQQLLHIRNNKCWYFSIDGKQLGEPIVIRNDKGDLYQPRISPSGKSIGFY